MLVQEFMIAAEASPSILFSMLVNIALTLATAGVVFYESDKGNPASNVKSDIRAAIGKATAKINARKQKKAAKNAAPRAEAA